MGRAGTAATAGAGWPGGGGGGGEVFIQGNVKEVKGGLGAWDMLVGHRKRRGALVVGLNPVESPAIT